MEWMERCDEYAKDLSKFMCFILYLRVFPRIAKSLQYTHLSTGSSVRADKMTIQTSLFEVGTINEIMGSIC